MIGENVGSQDQVAAAFGGLNLVEFDAQREFRVKVMPLQKSIMNRLQGNLLLFYTGISRFASKIAGEQIENAKKNVQSLTDMREMAYEAARILTDCRVDDLDGVDDFGRLMHESWMLKRGLGSKVTNDTVDQMYAAAREKGALGGKLCGAGGGGFLMLYVRPEDQAAVIEALSDLLLVPFEFENLGSHVHVLHQISCRPRSSWPEGWAPGCARSRARGPRCWPRSGANPSSPTCSGS